MQLQTNGDDEQQDEANFTAAKAAKAILMVREAQEMITTHCEKTNVACLEAQLALVGHLCAVRGRTLSDVAAKLEEVKYCLGEDREDEALELIGSALLDLESMAKAATISKEQTH